MLNQDNLALTKGSVYKVSLKASSTSSTDTIRVGLRENGIDVNGDGNVNSDWDTVRNIAINASLQTYTCYLIMPTACDGPGAAFSIFIGATAGTITIDDVSLTKAGTIIATNGELLSNGGFDYGSSLWNVYTESGASVSPSFSNGNFFLSGGTRNSDFWNVQLASNKIALSQNAIYTFSFKAKSTSDSDVIVAGVGDQRRFIHLSQALNTYTLEIIPGKDYLTSKTAVDITLGYTSGDITIDDISLIKTANTYSPPSSPEMVYNGDFTHGNNFFDCWIEKGNGATNTGSYNGGAFTITGANRGSAVWDVQLKGTLHSPGLATTPTKYLVSFQASSTVATDAIEISLHENGVDIDGDGATNTGLGWSSFTLGTSAAAYTYELTIPSPVANLEGGIDFAVGATTGTVSVDNISVQPE
jgi:hypothetical protein